MAEALLLVLLVALTLYAVFGGADFGVGIIEPLLDAQHRKAIDRALAPVWEANHVWLVVAVVIAFVGFPALFSLVSTYLHVPLLLVLLGIVARGSAFTFRHYDPDAGRLGPWYSWAFRLGSLLTPMFLGVIAAACVEGGLDDDPTRGAYALFIAPWNTPFCWATGLFTCALFAFEGAALLAAEQPSLQSSPLLTLTRRLHALAIVLGGSLFALGWAARAPWVDAFFSDALSLTCLAVATLFIPLVAYAFAHGKRWTLRLAVGAQISAVLTGLFSAQFPLLLRMSDGGLSLAQAVAPPATLRSLAIAVAIGLSLIMPSLAYLLRVYKSAPSA
jgi:cytochrome bd ubiquinol oxidase subunit II